MNIDRTDERPEDIPEHLHFAIQEQEPGGGLPLTVKDKAQNAARLYRQGTDREEIAEILGYNLDQTSKLIAFGEELAP